MVDDQHGQFAKGRYDEERSNAAAEKNAWVDDVVRTLDMTLILTGAPEREELVELWFAALKAVLYTKQLPDGATQSLAHHPTRDTSNERTQSGGFPEESW